MYAKQLIDRARELGHADAYTARQIGVSRSYLCDIHAGRKQISPESAALLADLVGLDATEALKQTAVMNTKDPDRRAALRRALFVCWVLGVVASLAGTTTGEDVHQQLTVYTLSLVAVALAAAALRAASRSAALLSKGSRLGHARCPSPSRLTTLKRR